MNTPRRVDGSGTELLAVSPPEHGMMGLALVVVLHSVVPAGAFAWLLLEPWTPAELPTYAVFWAMLGCMGAFVAESFRRSECWTWFFLAPLLLFGTVYPLLAAGAVLRILAGGEAPGADVVACAGLSLPLVACLRYLWTRRWQFWSDPPSRASRRPERRWVTPEWRAARLARIAAGARPPRADTSGDRAAYGASFRRPVRPIDPRRNRSACP